mmetsp:Transcript_31643/g.36312  ORF Transcript_31643/g.36312 Transcript_31643/m.36312 type:complete len:82 (+) Transcript_31643:623-868(+)|eukprot:CAMPEP_0170813142 /NCGR_PEP_ID=MMETSP0733-20121128/36592_1 /TAXON_ID=186038 /ORGANISM="Fragilariopsis kerguelensis, Strain L26-C5" /LENGTH=81 /DNA_ID=CAMNT_0011170263 /DNA_START=25 /DNA_END=270 /DNA_ORIENTATION=+
MRVGRMVDDDPVELGLRVLGAVIVVVVVGVGIVGDVGFTIRVGRIVDRVGRGVGDDGIMGDVGDVGCVGVAFGFVGDSFGV